MKVNTTRFGDLNVDDKDILVFEEGLLGFENLKKFFVVDPGDNTLILWLQSIEDGEIAFPILEPKIYKPDYTAKLMPADMKPINLENISEASIYTILTIPGDITQMSANLKAPIVINRKTKEAKQIVLQDNKLIVRYPMYIELKKYISNFSSDDSKRTQVTVQSVADAADSAQTVTTGTAAPNDNKLKENQV